MMNRKGFSRTAALMASCTMFALPAWAQQADTPDPAEENVAADIVVTAQKREERLQDVPIAVSVVSGDLLDRQGAVSLENAQYLVPTLNFRKSGTTINQSLFLRGVGTSTFSIAGEPSVSTVVDGVVYSRAGEAFSDLIDIERLEVLRGPQGTLFGKNGSAGVVNIVTRRPGNELGGYVEGAFYFDQGNEYRVRGALDVPLGANISSRFTGFYGNYEGNLFNRAVNTRVNGYEHYGVRGMIVAEPTPDLTFTLIADWRQAKDDCCAELIGTAPTGAAGALLNPANVLPTPRGDETREVNQNLVTATNEESYGASLQVDATLGGLTVTSITAWRRYDNEEIRDGDWLDQAYVGVPQLHDIGPQTGETFTQEVRLASPGGETIDYTLGFFYSNADTERTFTRNVISCTRTPAPTTLTPCTAPGTVITRPNGSATFGSTFSNLALFGQATLNLTERLRLIGGFRYTYDQLEVFHRRVSPLTGPGIAASFGPFNGKTTNNDVSGRAGVQFDIVPESVAYATYSRGYKGPAFNVFFNLGATGTNVIEPETADSYEIGLKNSLFGGRLVINLAAYYAKYENFQANNPDLVEGVVVTRFTNAGTISTRGGELDFLWSPARDVSVSGGVAYTDARVDRFRVPTSGNVVNVVPDGTSLAYAPDWKASVAGDWRIRTGGAIDIGVNGQAAWQTEQLSQFDASAAVRAVTTIEEYALVDLAASIIDAKDRFRVTFQVKNLFDQSFASAITSGGPGGSFRYIIPREADRYFGLIGRVNF
ncbi:MULTISPECIES: TonB-dependent receptor [unclassified Sphingomonas]|jgi:iron complex outermembrane receptor protein|uniref:TonB-dependent receptor n=1 Tax=unclassified Sphingomonas TaxID=196159 RepID=UPI0009E9E325|nr:MULTISPECIES: TonB-dependent receptor [unclassified Sphingomonas]